MPDVVDLMYKAFAKIERYGKKITDDTFMFGIFNKIEKKVNLFDKYMEYMFEHKKSSPIGSFNNGEKVTPWDLLRCDLTFCTTRDIIKSNPMTVEVGIHAAIIFAKSCGTRARPPRSTVAQLEEPRA